jgi:molecular chaperone DnaK (HSP70)
VGLDFGTTHFCIVVKDSNGLRTITDGYENRTFPTTVSVEDGVWEVGRHKITDAHGRSTVIDGVKRVIGRDSRDPRLESEIQRLRLPFALRDGEPCSKVGDEHVTALEITALIFMKAKENYERETGETAGSCVLTVPAYFTGRQSRCVEDAARIAGWKPFRIVNEPAAVAVAELSSRYEDGEYLIVDCGGGTLDCTVVKRETVASRGMKTFVVSASSGDNALGGYDFLRIMADLVGRRLPNARRDEVMSACEKAMSRRRPEDQDIRIDIGNISHKLPVSDYKTACRSLHSRIRKTLRELEREAPTKVLLAGGATRNPIFKDLVREYVGDQVEFLNLSVTGSEVVARGAAIIAAQGDSSNDSAVAVTDILSRSLGIDTQVRGGRGDNMMEVILHRHTELPASHTEEFVAVHKEETKITLYEGENPQSSNNIFLEEFLNKASPEESILVTIKVDEDSTIVVTAVGVQNRVEKTVARASKLQESAILQMRQRAEERLISRADKAKKPGNQTAAKRAGDEGKESDKGKRAGKRKRR